MELIRLIDIEQNTGDPRKPQSQPSTGDIKIEYHPNSKRPPETIPLKEYQHRRRKTKGVQRMTTRRPWKPFQTRSEFEFAEVALKASLTKGQVDALIQVIKRCVDGEDKFELHSHSHMCEVWNAGSVLHTTVSCI